MPEWWTYTLSDFLMFSPRVYYRMFELHNGALWPAQLVTMGVGVVILGSLARPGMILPRAGTAMLGGLWIGVAWAFFWERYATINWAAVYVAPAFALEGLLLIWAGAIEGKLRAPRRQAAAGMAAIALFGAAVVAYPLLAPLMQRPWAAAEVFGIAPDPTAIATLALLAVVDAPRRRLLMAIPLAWCAISATTLWTMGAVDAALVLAAALAAIAIAIASFRRSVSASR